MSGWCPRSLRRQIIIRHGIDYGEQTDPGPASISDKTSYRNISWSL